MTLFIDYAGAMFESWFYSEGRRFRGKTSFDVSEILYWARKNDFSKFTYTDEAKKFAKQ